MKDLVIVGHSGFAKEIKWIIDRINYISPTWDFWGYIDCKKDKGVIGDDNYVIECDKDLSVVIAIANGDIRKSIYEKYRKNKNISFPNVIDPSVLYSDDLQLGKGNIICAGSILTVEVEFGDFNIVNLDCSIGHEAILEDYVTFNPSVNVSGKARIGSFSNIGTGTQILQGKKIGEHTIVGAGAVVTSDIAGNCTVVGIPAKIIKNNRE